MDQAMIRDLGLIVTDSKGFFSEEKRDASHEVLLVSSGVPAFVLTNTCLGKRYSIEKCVISDPHRPVVLQRIRFSALQGNSSDYRVHFILAPHIGNRGAENTAWVGEYKGHEALLASRESFSLALASSAKMKKLSAGFAGYSDGWQDLKANGCLTNCYERAENGNVALTAEIDAAAGEFVLALGFGVGPDEAAHQAIASLLEGFDSSLESYQAFWNEWSREKWKPRQKRNLFNISESVLKTHMGMNIPGGMIASFSIPWGSSKGDDDLGGYHLIWPRDMVEAAGALLAVGAFREVRDVLTYLQSTQEPDGHWPQNMWTDGRKYWNGIQLDETAFPVLLADLAKRKGAIAGKELERYWPMIKSAAAFIARTGPVSQQDRWEEDPGYSPFTLSVEIAALVTAAEYARKFEEKDLASYFLATADTWNSNIERWIYVTDTSLASQLDVEGYYVRISPIDKAEAGSPKNGYVPIRNRPASESSVKATHIISPDALALVRFGLRSADDSRITNTVKVIDKLLRIDFPSGPSWHRYNDDGYGEHEDGGAFDGVGIGRAWPLLTGERAHYELARGNFKSARSLLGSFASFAGEGGLLPEQVWDAKDIPDKELFFGRPTGSAMPLVWAHAEYLKLVRSLEEKSVFDMPPQTVSRYLKNKSDGKFAFWRFNHKIRKMEHGLALRIEVLANAVVHWTTDGWASSHDTPTGDTGIGIFVADLNAGKMQPGACLSFTFYWQESQKWEGADFFVDIF